MEPISTYINSKFCIHDTYRIPAFDPIIHRTMVYGGLTAAMAVFYIGSVFVLQRLFEAITGQQSDLAIVLSTLAISALFQPLRRRLQNLIDRAFYREQVDFRRTFTNFSREIRTIIELPELLTVLIDRTTQMLHIAHAAVFLHTAGEEDTSEFELVETRNLPPGRGDQLTLRGSQIGRLTGHSTIPGTSISREGNRVSSPTSASLIPRGIGKEVNQVSTTVSRPGRATTHSVSGWMLRAES